MRLTSHFQRQVDVLWTEQEIDEIIDPAYAGDTDIETVRRNTLERAVRAEMDEELWNEAVRAVVRTLADHDNRIGGVALFGGQIDLAAQERYVSAPFRSVGAIERSFVDRFGFPQWAGPGPSIDTELQFRAITRLVQASPISAIWRDSGTDQIEESVESYYWEQKQRWEERFENRW